MLLLKRLLNGKLTRRLKVNHPLDSHLDAELSALRVAAPPSSGMARTLTAVRETAPSPLAVRPRRSSRRRLLPALSLSTALLLFVGGAVYWNFINRPPISDDVTSTSLFGTQTYNGYRDLAKKVHLNSSDVMRALEQLGTIGNAGAVNAYAGAHVGLLTREELLRRADSLLSMNVSVRAELRRRLTLPYAEPDAGFQQEISSIMPLKPLSDILLLEARAAQERGDYKTAAKAALDALQFATQLQQNCFLGTKMSAMHWERAARKILWEVLLELDQKTLAYATHYMNRTIAYSNYLSLEHSMKREKYVGTALLLNLLHEPHWRWGGITRLRRYLSNEPYQDGSFRFGEMLSTLRWSNQKIMDNYTGTMATLISLVRLPYRMRADMINSETNLELRSHDPVTDLLLPSLRALVLRDAVSQTENQLLHAAMSLHRYRGLKGYYPQRLTETVWLDVEQYKHLYHDKQFCTYPRHDPFSTIAGWREQMKYRRTKDGKGYLLYSVGPDGKDNGGVPIENKKVNQGNRLQYAITDDALGDIVAGINLDWQ